MSPDSKRVRGCYYTESNPFTVRAFKPWARRARLKERTVLEPFAGSNNLIDMLDGLGLCGKSKSYDIRPASPRVAARDTIRDFPTGYEACISNPPWLGRYSAKRRGLPWPDIGFDDLYKHCLELALENCDHVGFIIPATFLHSGQFRDRLESVTFLNNHVFADTENPVCLALFAPHATDDTEIYYDSKRAGSLKGLQKHLPQTEPDMSIRFNEPGGGAWPVRDRQHGKADHPVLPRFRSAEQGVLQFPLHNAHRRRLY